MASIEKINEVLDANIRRGEVATLLGLRLSQGGGDWSQIRHFTPARNSARLSQYVAGKLAKVAIPETVTRFNAEYGPTDVERNREAAEYVECALQSKWRATPLLALPWFGDNSKQRSAIQNDKPNMRVFGVALAQGCIDFIDRWS